MPLGAQNLRRIRGSARCTIAVVGRMKGYRIAPGVAKVAGTLPARLEVIVHLPNYLGPSGLGPACTCVSEDSAVKSPLLEVSSLNLIIASSRRPYLGVELGMSLG